jgi:hypothetical protein
MTKQINEIAYIISNDILAGMKGGKGVDGKPLPKNEVKTIKKKGHGKQLFDTGKLSKFYVKRATGSDNPKAQIVPPKDREAMIQGWVIDGIKVDGKTKFYNFWGISDEAEKKANEYIFLEIQRLLSK